MKKIWAILPLLLLAIPIFSQSLKGLSRSEMMEALNKQKGYATQDGWNIMVGDTLHFGVGSMPNKTFAYCYESPQGAAKILLGVSDKNNGMGTGHANMQSYMAHKIAVVKGFNVTGVKKIGYTVMAIIGIGGGNNYWVEIDNAVTEHEILPPASILAKRKISEDANSISNASSSTNSTLNTMTTKLEQLKSLKQLLSDSTLTKQEFDIEKKKILNQ